MADLGRIATQSDRLDAALALTPLNADIRMARIGGLLPDQSRLAEVGHMARIGRNLHRADGRFDSVLGVIAHQDGDVAAARAHFEAALAKQPTEFQALRHLMAYNASEGRWGEAADLLMVLGRRWPRQWRDHERMVLVMAGNPEGRAALIDSFMDAPHGRGLIVDSLLRADSALLAGELLATWHDRGAEDPPRLIGRVTQHLLRRGMTETALLLDRFTIGADRPPPQGFVNNASFAFEPSGSAFDWSARPQQGVSFEWHGTGADPVGRGTGTNGPPFVRLRFLDSPLRLDNLTQSLVLRPARHRLEVRARARGLRAPKPVHVTVRCQRATIAELVLDPLSENWREFAAPFDVPAGCPSQTVSVGNGFMPLSWSSRYQGVIDIGRIQIIGLP